MIRRPKMNNFSRGPVLGAASALAMVVAVGSAAAQTYPPGTNCQSLLPGLYDACMNQVQQMNSGNSTNSGTSTNSGSTIVPNSAGSNTVPAPGTVNSGTTVSPNSNVNPNTAAPNGTTNGAANPSGGTI